MASARPSVEDSDRLLSVQARVRSLVHAHPGLREAINAAWPQFLELTRIHLRDKWSASQGQVSGGDEPIDNSPRSLAPDPRELERANLRRFSDPDRRTIVLARLGWLADVGEPLPIIEEVPRSGDPEDFVIQYVSELAVTPVDGVGDSAMELGAPRPYHFAPSVAEAFLRHLEGWVARGDFGPRNGPAKAGEVINARNAPGIGGTETDWRAVQGWLLGKRERNESYTSLRKLCAELKCSDATIRKAIDESETLKGWQARSTGTKAAPKATDLGEVVRDNARQTTEPAPDDVLPDDDVDATMARLIDQANPDERAKLNALDDAGRRALVATYQSQNLDDEPSPLEPDRPGERPRKVKQHKWA